MQNLGGGEAVDRVWLEARKSLPASSCEGWSKLFQKPGCTQSRAPCLDPVSGELTACLMRSLHLAHRILQHCFSCRSKPTRPHLTTFAPRTLDPISANSQFRSAGPTMVLMLHWPTIVTWNPLTRTAILHRKQMQMRIRWLWFRLPDLLKEGETSTPAQWMHLCSMTGQPLTMASSLHRGSTEPVRMTPCTILAMGTHRTATIRIIMADCNLNFCRLKLNRSRMLPQHRFEWEVIDFSVSLRNNDATHTFYEAK